MRLPKSTLGLMLILGGLILTRAAIYYSHATAGMDAREIWHAMPSRAQGAVLLAFTMAVVGAWLLLVAVWNVFGRRGR